MVFYAVAHGREVGIYNTWEECKQQTHGFSGAVFKKCKSMVEASAYMSKNQAALSTLSPSKANGHVEKKGGRGSLRNCAATKQYLKQKLKDQPNEIYYERAFSKPLTFNDSQTEKIVVKREPIDFGADFLPLQDIVNNNVVIKKEKEEPIDATKDIVIKKEKKEPMDADCSAFFDDKEGDLDLMLALSCLQEHPDPIPIKPKTEPKSVKKPIRIGNYKFTVDGEGFVDVYIAGYYENTGRWNCSAGYGVCFSPNHALNATEAALGKMSHFVGDLEAAIYALRTAKDVGIKKMCLHTNCSFLLKAVTSWMHAWRQNDWRNKNGKVISNRKEFLKLDSLLQTEGISVKWRDASTDSEKDSVQGMLEAKKLARYGCEEYIELHPNKEKDFEDDFGCGNFFDYFDY